VGPTSQEIADWMVEPRRAASWLMSLGVRNSVRALQNLANLAEAGIPLDLLAMLVGRLPCELKSLSDPDMALNNLDRFVQASRSPLSVMALFERDPASLRELLQIFSVSQHQSDLLIADPSAFDRLRFSNGMPASRDELIDDLRNELRCHTNERSAHRLLHAFRQREMARIAYGDVIRGQRIPTVTRQLSYVADAVCEAALELATSPLQERFGVPCDEFQSPCHFVVIGLGKLGGLELNYSSDIDLVFFYDNDGTTDGARSISNHEYFQKLGRTLMRLLTETSDYGALYRVDLRLRPDGQQGPIAISEQAARQYYETKGRNWERQAWIKGRPVAGQMELGLRILGWLQPWVYRSFLGYGDIFDIRILKRQIEQQAIRRGTDVRDIKIGRGGIRDIEFIVQFLQLLYGGHLPAVRKANTLEALASLEFEACLTHQERTILEEGYVFLRKLEHFLQIMYDRQTHALPVDHEELVRLAIRMGYAGASPEAARQQFEADLAAKRRLHRRILDHILHRAFPEDEAVLPEVDLVMLPDMPAELVQDVLRKYGFRDPDSAYHELLSLGSEQIRFLSDARCRRLLAVIAQPLLAEIAKTPDPDGTLIQLSQVSHSLGGKAVLWELFQVNPASLRLYVRLCTAAPYLAGILTSNPGMLDELMDSLVLGRLPSTEDVFRSLVSLCAGAEDIEPILHGFKNSMHLRVGVRDILRKDDIESTTATLADIAEACLQQTIRHEFRILAQKFGTPRLGADSKHPRNNPAAVLVPDPLYPSLTLYDDECDFIVLGMGKLGGREPNYHSDLDLVFLYETDGTTQHRVQHHQESNTSNQHFFAELAQRVIRSITRTGPLGRLYELDPRLRPAGSSGTMAVSLEAFDRYFVEGHGQLWERQALCKARPVFGTRAGRQRALDCVARILVRPPWRPEFAAEILQMRYRMEQGAAATNLKRGPGGTVDIEFLVQMLQLCYAATDPTICVPGTLPAIQSLRLAGALEEEDALSLDRNYRFMRGVEARIRLMNFTARHELPQEPNGMAKLAYLLEFADRSSLVRACEETMKQNRQLLLKYQARLSHELV
jgi:glutamate-ammonia-ligase adenylyltransferase